ncbi:MAG: hypothetical protein WC710_13420 [Gallionella sp.]|jgi:hypothetical protein
MENETKIAGPEAPVEPLVGHDAIWSDTPRVDAMIAKCMRRYPGARYYEEVHQELAPLARELEREAIRLRTALDSANPKLVILVEPDEQKE